MSKYDPFPQFKYTGKQRAVYPLSQTRTLPSTIPRPDYAITSLPLSEQKLRGSTQIHTLTQQEQTSLRSICQLSRQVLEAGKKAAKVGVTTDEIDRVVHEMCVELGVYPSPLNYFEFPKSCCTSVNEVICHGIPDQYTQILSFDKRYELKDGDIVNIDVSCFNGQMHGDLNDTVLIGNVNESGL